MKGGWKKRALRAAAAVLTAAALFLAPSCKASDGEAEQAASRPLAASAAPEIQDGGGQGQTPVYSQPSEEAPVRTATYHVVDYTMREGSLDFAVSYPQMDGTGYEQVNELLRERGLQTVNLLIEEERRRQEALLSSQAASAASSGAESSASSAPSAPQAASAPVSSAPAADRLLTLMGGSQCYLPSGDFLSVAFTMDITDSTQAYPSCEWYTLNVNLRSGEEVTCADLFSDLDGLAAALRKQAESDGLDESVLTYLTQDKLRAGLPGVPGAFGSGFAEFGFPVPRAAGDVLRISLPLATAAAFRSDNALWDVIGIS